MIDTRKPIEAFDNILQQNANLQAIRGYCIINNEDATLIRRALKLAEAVEKDLAEGRVMVPSELIREQWEAMGNVQYIKPLAGLLNIHHDVVSEHIYKAAITAAPQSHISALED